jgi:hypothetical protein
LPALLLTAMAAATLLLLCASAVPVVREATATENTLHKTADGMAVSRRGSRRNCEGAGVGPGLAGNEKRLEPMEVAGTTNYGAFLLCQARIFTP